MLGTDLSSRILVKWTLDVTETLRSVQQSERLEDPDKNKSGTLGSFSEVPSLIYSRGSSYGLPSGP